MTEQHDPPVHGSLAELREHTRRLANDLAGALRRVSVRSGDTTIEVEWQEHPEPADGHPAPVVASAAPATVPTDDRIMVCSPMVGTVYRASAPDAAAFVDVGDTVEIGQTVVIVEAMKLFNPITAESEGVVAEVLVENGQSVEFGQPLLALAATDGAGE
ncbi:MAG TPA: acetyl-CoA carboxylase biotin carboxyl carrier protein [Pseudonocardiaceae bacterium]|jgi:acetyl-CoA carboxylase biotin carboxyl carrier protein|nr:acetyl-CoA carboxylase biotin carboxyl carrier protein [Pseudonocardiaceae bacterium]